MYKLDHKNFIRVTVSKKYWLLFMFLEVKLKDFLNKIKGGLVVSCQAQKGEPFYGSRFMVAFALAAVKGGAVGIRTNGPTFIRAIDKATDLPIIGIYKREYEDSPIYITPTKREARSIALAGADVVGIDCTLRKRPHGLETEELVKYTRKELGLPVLADISTFEEAVRAEDIGADVVCTTLNGYTEYTKERLGAGPDIDLVEDIARKVKIPVIAEGRFWQPEEVRKAIDVGAHAVCVGTAITRPHLVVQYMKSRI